MATAMLATAATYNIASGVSAAIESEGMAAQQRAQGDVARIEAYSAADKYERDARAFGEKQKVQYLKSGVRLEGSPLLIAQETAIEANISATSMRNRGDALRSLYREKAVQTQSSGRAALIGGLAQGAANIGMAGAYSKGGANASNS